jgi:hypothetical protein
MTGVTVIPDGRSWGVVMSSSRFGTGLLGTFGVALAGLMAYTLGFEGCDSVERSTPTDETYAEVAVFFPDRRDWSAFRRGVLACVQRGLASPVGEDDESVTLRATRSRRAVRFRWHGCRGVDETQAEADRLTGETPRAVAVVGSSNTILTVALAEVLAEQGADGPLLLVPRAPARKVTVDPSASLTLLEIHRGRTFRFCSRSDRLARSVVDGVRFRDGGTVPSRVDLIIDPYDPASVDLAAAFREAIAAVAPGAEVVEHREAVGVPKVAREAGSVVSPSHAEYALAEAIWASATGTRAGPTWVVVPLPTDPLRRILTALQRRATWRGSGESDGPIRILTGDGAGKRILGEFAGTHAFSIAAASSASAPPGELGLTDESQVLAETVSAILLAVEASNDRILSPEALRAFLASLDLPANHPAAFSRGLAFETNGERRGDFDHLLICRPGSSVVQELARRADGTWVPIEERP